MDGVDGTSMYVVWLVPWLDLWSGMTVSLRNVPQENS
jgi:hypothetical protein